MTHYRDIAGSPKLPGGIALAGNNPSACDVDAVVAWARAAFESGVWSALHPKDHKQVLLKLAGLIDQHCEELAVMEALDAGKPITGCVEIDIPETANCIRWHAEAQDKLCDQIARSAPDRLGLIVREQIGVVAVTRVESDDEAIALANATDYGLAAKLCTRDSPRQIALRCNSRRAQ